MRRSAVAQLEFVVIVVVFTNTPSDYKWLATAQSRVARGVNDSIGWEEHERQKEK